MVGPRPIRRVRLTFGTTPKRCLPSRRMRGQPCSFIRGSGSPSCPHPTCPEGEPITRVYLAAGESLRSSSSRTLEAAAMETSPLAGASGPTLCR
jgi:hypothetical protein